MTPIRATPDNPAIMLDGRLVADGPAAANIPGVVAGLDYLYKKYGSGKVKWAELIEPAITLADEGFILDESLPTTIAEGRRFLEKYPESAKIFLPGGKVPHPGDRFVNKDYANTLRAIAKDGGETFYRGEIARKIAADLEEQGGIIGFADLAQYRAIEREPIVGHYRGHSLYAGGPPVSTGIQLFESLHVLENYQPRAGRARDDRCRLPALPDRVVEGARSGAARRRSRALAGGLRGASLQRAREEALREDRSAQGLALRASAAGRCAGAAAGADLHRAPRRLPSPTRKAT